MKKISLSVYPLFFSLMSIKIYYFSTKSYYIPLYHDFSRKYNIYFLLFMAISINEKNRTIQNYILLCVIHLYELLQ